MAQFRLAHTATPSVLRNHAPTAPCLRSFVCLLGKALHEKGKGKSRSKSRAMRAVEALLRALLTPPGSRCQPYRLPG